MCFTANNRPTDYSTLNFPEINSNFLKIVAFVIVFLQILA
jgi:hypothetical protein